MRESGRLGSKLFGDNDLVCLLLGDVDAIKAFVYETSKLPEIRGASEMLVELEGEVRRLFGERLSEECLIYCGGGGFLAVVPAGEAEEWKKEIERLCLERTKTATITVAVSRPRKYAELRRGLPPYDESSVQSLEGPGVTADLLFSHFEALTHHRLARKGFGELVADLSARLQRLKREKEKAPFYPALPIHLRCQSCGKRPAFQVDAQVTPPERLCPVCDSKREKGRRQRSSFAARFAEWFAERHGQRLSASTPQDLDRLTRGEGKVAFLYADGNNMGDLLQLAKTPPDYRSLSEALEQAVSDALFEALAEVVGQEALVRTPYLPFEIIALGGDDVSVMAPASLGWRLACRFLRRFGEHEGIRRVQRELQERWGREMRLTMSAGLAIADAKYPVRFLRSLSESLLKEAKHLARQANQSTLCHLWLRAPIASEDGKTVLRALYRREGRQTWWITARPFTLLQAEELTRLAGDLQALSATQRKMLAQALEQGVRASLNLALYEAQRLREDAKRLTVLEALRRLGELLGGEEERFLFWRYHREKGWRTALLDALELAELRAVRKGEGRTCD